MKYIAFINNEETPQTALLVTKCRLDNTFIKTKHYSLARGNISAPQKITKQNITVV